MISHVRLGTSVCIPFIAPLSVIKIIARLIIWEMALTLINLFSMSFTWENYFLLENARAQVSAIGLPKPRCPS